MKHLENKVGLITGGSSGIGFEVAKQALIEGAKSVIITGQNEERLEVAVEVLSEYGSVLGVRWSAQETKDTVDLGKFVQEKYGSIDFVFANAGVSWTTPIGEIDAEAVQLQMMVNFTGPLMLVQTLVPHLNKGASVILTTSCLNQLGIPGYSAYSASKAALRSLARTLSAELMEKDIRVNTIAPGPFVTPILEKLGLEGKDLENMKEQVASMVPIGRMGQPHEISQAVVFLASDGSHYMRGTEINVDGGWATL